jgi:hypothetical protein
MRRSNGNAPALQNGKWAGEMAVEDLYRDELLAQVRSLCHTVGFSLARNVLKMVANVHDVPKVRDLAKLTMAFEKLQDLARGGGTLSYGYREMRRAAVFRGWAVNSTWPATRWMAFLTARRAAGC